MHRNPVSKTSFSAPARSGFVLASMLPLCIATANAMELDFADGAVAGRFDNTISYGVAVRTQGADRDFAAESDPSLTYPAGTPNAGRPVTPYVQLAPRNVRTQANKNDGNLNFPDAGDLVSNTVKLNSLLELTWENYGVQVSGFAFHDMALADIEDSRGTAADFINNVDSNDVFDTRRLPEAAADYAVSDARLSSGYVWGDFEMGDRTLNVRLGEQVLSWGEALFLQDGINVVNPADLSALRLPGAEIKDALLPLPMLVMSTNLTESLSTELFYAFGWDNSEADPVGTFYSTTDAFFGHGAESVIIDLDDTTGGNDARLSGLEHLARLYNAEQRGIVYDPATGAGVDDPFGSRVSTNKLSDVDPKDDGQFGIAFRYMAESLNNTEFGFYFLNTHSKKPTAGAVLGEAYGTVTDRDTCRAAFEAIKALRQVGFQPRTCADLKDVADGTLLPADPALAARAQGAVQGMNAVHYLDTSAYFLEYQEDIQTYGLTFSTNIGETSLSGEVAYRPELPFLPEVGDNLIALNTINASLLGNGGTVADGSNGQHITAGSITANAGAAGLSAGDTISLVSESEAVNFSLVGIHNFGPALGADGLIAIVELGGAWLGDLKPGIDYAAESALGLAQTCTNAADASTCTPATVQVDTDGDGTTETVQALVEGKESQYLDDFAWGYRLVLATEFNDVAAGLNLKPQVRFAHDVQGNGIVGGNFVEDRMSGTVAVDAEYANDWVFSVGTNTFWGAEDRNQLKDRDNVFASVKYSF